MAGHTFGQRLRAARQAAGFSQSDMSQRSGLPKPTLSRYENGHVLPSLATLRKLADALGVADADLLTEATSPYEVFVKALRKRGVTLRTAEEAQELADRVGEFLTQSRRRAQ